MISNKSFCVIVVSLLILGLMPCSFAFAQDSDSRKPLSDLPIPGPDNLSAFDGSLSSKIDDNSVSYTEFVIDEDALIDLGKALFWDMQLGSDGIQACASCHFGGGADPRSINQLNPGQNAGDNSFQLGGPNYQLKASDFPFHKLSDDEDRKSSVVSSVNEVASSQGVFGTTFLDIIPGDDEDDLEDIHRDRPFALRGFDTRRVEPRNTPSVVNSVFNFRNFWDGRANNNFNGVNPFGNRDEHAKVVSDEGSGAETVKVLLPLSSAASQAVGPPLSDFEMASVGRTWPKVGKKMVDPAIVPLGKQIVDNTDSRLGSLSDDDGSHSIPGLSTSYEDMVKAAINSRWWDSDAIVTFSAASNGTPVPTVIGTGTPSGTDEYTLMEANFSMIFGLAVQAYEQELISDKTPFDSYAAGDESALSDAQKRGLDIFDNKAKCSNCHGGTTFSGATVEEIGNDDTDSESSFTIIERMEMASHIAAATVVFGIGDIPTLDPGIEHVKQLRKDPRGMFIEIKDNVNEVLFSGVFPDTSSFSFPPSAPCSSSSESIQLDAISSAIDTLLTVADAELKVRDNCSTTFRVRIENGFASLPTGVYDIYLDNRLWSQIRIEIHAVYDNGFYNIGIRPTDDDLGVGGTDPFGNPLSFTEMELLDPGRSDIREGLPSSDGFNPSDPIGSLGEQPAVRGAFKTPILRNLKLSAPFFHNGGQRTVEEVVRFYNRGGDFSDGNIRELDPDIVVLNLSEDEIADLVDFLENGLFDERPFTQVAPFDHPQLFYPEGHDPIDGITIFAEAEVVGAGGGVEAETFEDKLDPSSIASGRRDMLAINQYSNSPVNDEIASEDDAVPTIFDLAQNYPNPFNPTTSIRFSLAKSIQVNLEIYNILGQRVKTLVSGELQAGWHEVSWDGTNDAGEQLASGIYIYNLKTPNFEHSRKMSLTK